MGSMEPIVSFPATLKEIWKVENSSDTIFLDIFLFQLLILVTVILLNFKLGIACFTIL